MNPPYHIGVSNIHGVGVIATQFIAKGTLIPMPWYFSTPKIGVVFNGFNHSCQPTLSRVGLKMGDGRIGHPTLVDIRPGEELTLSYWVKEADGCQCPSCRGKR